MFSNDELRAASLRNPHRVVMIRVVGVAVLVAGLVLCPVPGSSQTTLDDLVIRAFDIDVSMSPVPLKYDTVGGQRRYAARGTLRGTTTAMLEVTAPSPVSTARFFFDSDVKLTSVTATRYRIASARRRDALTLTFTPALPAGARVAVTFAYEGRPLYIFDEFVLVSEGSLYPVLTSPFGDFSANLARVKLKLRIPDGYQIAGTGRQLGNEGGVRTWDTEVPVPWEAVAGGRRHTVRDRVIGGLRMQFYVPPGDDRNLDKLADFTCGEVVLKSKILDPIPYSKLHVLAALSEQSS